jgi:capsular exopolysaccharide synthesis family protein
MSRLFEALRRMETERRSSGEGVPEPARPIEFLSETLGEAAKTEAALFTAVEISPTPRLVALRDRQGLAAEKFRALAARLGNLRRQREMKSLQVTSSTVGEGKTVVAANLAATLTNQSGSRVLLVEGDLHRPALCPLFGLSGVHGLSHWWSGQDEQIERYIYQLGETSLCLLSGGQGCDEPSQMLQSGRFASAFTNLATRFDWIIVDSAPMLPTATANLWSRLVDGTLLVVREGVAPVRGLRKGVEALDNPRLVGIVLNDAAEVGRASYRYADASLEVPQKIQ